MKSSTGGKLQLPEHVTNCQRSDSKSAMSASPLLKIISVSLSKLPAERCLNVNTNFRPLTSRQNKQQLQTPAVTCSAARRIVFEDYANEGDKPDRDFRPKFATNTEQGTGTHTIPLGILPCKISPKYNQLSDSHTKLSKSTIEDKIPMSHLTPATAYSRFKKLEGSKSNILQMDSNKHPQDTLVLANFCSKKPPQATSAKEKLKTQTDVKAPRFRTANSSFEANKISISEDTNVKKLIDAVSFHRWKYKLESCESDYQLLAKCVLRPMGSMFMETVDETRKRKSRRPNCETKPRKDCISLLLNTCNKNRLKLSSAVGTGKRNRKRKTVKKEKTAKRKNRKSESKLHSKSA